MGCVIQEKKGQSRGKSERWQAQGSSGNSIQASCCAGTSIGDGIVVSCRALHSKRGLERCQYEGVDFSLQGLIWRLTPLGVLNYHQAISFASGLRCSGHVLFAGVSGSPHFTEVFSRQRWSELSLCLVFEGWIFSTAVQGVTVSSFSQIHRPALAGLASTYIWSKLAPAWIQALVCVYERKWEMLLIIFLPELRNHSSLPLPVMGREEDRLYLS